MDGGAESGVPSAEEWADRTEVITRRDHEDYVACARSFVEEIIDGIDEAAEIVRKADSEREKARLRAEAARKRREMAQESGPSEKVIQMRLEAAARRQEMLAMRKKMMAMKQLQKEPEIPARVEALVVEDVVVLSPKRMPVEDRSNISVSSPVHDTPSSPVSASKSGRKSEMEVVTAGDATPSEVEEISEEQRQAKRKAQREEAVRKRKEAEKARENGAPSEKVLQMRKDAAARRQQMLLARKKMMEQKKDEERRVDDVESVIRVAVPSTPPPQNSRLTKTKKDSAAVDFFSLDNVDDAQDLVTSPVSESFSLLIDPMRISSGKPARVETVPVSTLGDDNSETNAMLSRIRRLAGHAEPSDELAIPTTVVTRVDDAADPRLKEELDSERKKYEEQVSLNKMMRAELETQRKRLDEQLNENHILRQLLEEAVHDAKESREKYRILKERANERLARANEQLSSKIK